MTGIMWPWFGVGFGVTGLLGLLWYFYLRPRLRLAYRQGDRDGMDETRDHDWFRGIYRLAYEYGYRDTKRVRARYARAAARDARNRARRERRQAKRNALRERRNP